MWITIHARRDLCPHLARLFIEIDSVQEGQSSCCSWLCVSVTVISPSNRGPTRVTSMLILCLRGSTSGADRQRNSLSTTKTEISSSHLWYKLKQSRKTTVSHTANTGGLHQPEIIFPEYHRWSIYWSVFSGDSWCLEASELLVLNSFLISDRRANDSRQTHDDLFHPFYAFHLYFWLCLDLILYFQLTSDLDGSTLKHRGRWMVSATAPVSQYKSITL